MSRPQHATAGRTSEGRASPLLGLSRLAFVLVLFVASAATPAAAQRDTTGNIEQQLSDSQQRLEQIRRERAQLRDAMTNLQSRVHSLTSELTNLERQTATSADLLEELQFQVTEREKQVAQTRLDLANTAKRLASRKEALRNRLRAIYERGPLRTAQVLLNAESFADLINRYKYLYLIARHDRQLVDDVSSLEEELVARQQALERSLAELREVEDERAREHEQLAQLQVQQEHALSGAQAREKATAERIARLEQDEQRLSDLINTLERRRREAEAAAAARAAGGSLARREPETASITPADMGSLAWPVQGSVLYRFGRHTQPNGTVLRWNGIGIRAELGATVHAVESGLVVLAGPFEGYGPTVVLSHGGGYYSLYLYLDNLMVEEGETVTRGEALGTVGGEDTPEGAHIEFQIRAPGGRAMDPLGWLTKQGG